MQGIFIGKFFHCMPCKKPHKDGKRNIINYYSFGPIESIIYGVTASKEYYFDYTYPELWGDAELEHEYTIIDKDRMLKAIDDEIKLCENNGGFDIARALREEKELIEES